MKCHQNIEKTISVPPNINKRRNTPPNVNNRFSHGNLKIPNLDFYQSWNERKFLIEAGNGKLWMLVRISDPTEHWRRCSRILFRQMLVSGRTDMVSSCISWWNFDCSGVFPGRNIHDSLDTSQPHWMRYSAASRKPRQTRKHRGELGEPGVLM